MNQGLIPVVSSACGIDIGDYGVLLEPCSIEEIQKDVSEVASYSIERHRKMSQSARQTAVTEHSEAAFAHKFASAVTKAIAEKQNLAGCAVGPQLS
jgi:hypothetical protein